MRPPAIVTTIAPARDNSTRPTQVRMIVVGLAILLGMVTYLQRACLGTLETPIMADLALSKAWEERSAPMVFTASSCDGASVVFDGQGDHVGEHLTYKRSGETLLIVGDFLHHGKPDREEWHMIAAKKE